MCRTCGRISSCTPRRILHAVRGPAHRAWSCTPRGGGAFYPRGIALSRGARRAGLIAVAVLALPVLAALMIVWHECAHTVTAWLVGDASARFVLALDTPRQQCVGCNLYDSAALDPARNALVNLAGVLGTQLLAWGSLLLLARRRRGAIIAVLLSELLLSR